MLSSQKKPEIDEIIATSEGKMGKALICKKRFCNNHPHSAILKVKQTNKEKTKDKQKSLPAPVEFTPRNQKAF